MKGKFVFVFCLLLSTSFLSFARFDQRDAKASSTLPIHNIDTGLNYSTIQEAINANETLDGQTILVDAGTYYENVVVNKSLSIIGANSESTVIDGNYTGNVVEIVNNVTLSGFTIRNSGGALEDSGIYLDGGVNCTISENQVINNNYGIYLYASVSSPTFSVITQNYIANSNVGISASEAYDTTFTANTIANSSQKGVFLFASEYNTFIHNNFINNTIQVYNWGESGKWPDTWDNGNSSGGNYWSDYKGNNTNHGFGNIPYSADELGNQDHYPLMGMFTSFNATSQDSVEIVSNSTVTDFQFNGTAISFNAAGENGTTGFCRINVPTAIINGTLAVFVNGTQLPFLVLPESNITQDILYFTYHHSTQQIIIAPEFQPSITLLLFVLATMIAVVLCRRKPNTRL